MKLFISAVAGAALFAAAPVASTTVDFTSTPQGATSNPLVIGDASFSTTGSLFVSDFAVDGNNQLCANIGDGCAAPLDVTFAAAISGLSFTAWGDDSTSTLTILLALADATTTTAYFAMDGVRSTYDLVDLSSYGSILGLSLNSDDLRGVSYDNFIYQQAAAVPEPGTWAMMLLGFGFAGVALRRRRRTSNIPFAA